MQTNFRWWLFAEVAAKQQTTFGFSFNWATDEQRSRFSICCSLLKRWIRPGELMSAIYCAHLCGS